MTNIDRILSLLSDGVSRTPTQISKSTKLTKAAVINALADIRLAGECVGQRQEFAYVITPLGQERAEQMQTDSERADELAAAAQASAKARAAIHAARTGAVPNSVFAWGQGSAA